MWYGIGYRQEVGPGPLDDANSTGWWERLCGPNTNVHACARNLGKHLLASTPKNPRSAMALTGFRLVRAEDLPAYGLPIPDKLIEQAQFDAEGPEE